MSTFNDETFDIIICHNVLEYIDDKEAVVKALVQVLKKGGILSIAKHNRAGRMTSSGIIFCWMSCFDFEYNPNWLRRRIYEDN